MNIINFIEKNATPIGIIAGVVSGGAAAVCTYKAMTKAEKINNEPEEETEELSNYANKLKQQGSNVTHGVIREVSLVLAAANPGAYIESVLSHGEASDEEAVIYTGEQ